MQGLRRRRCLIEVAPIWPADTDRIDLARTDSTNTEAARRANEATRPFWVRAAAQTSARGRRGRAWHTGPDNFAASYVAMPDLDPEGLAKYSFVAALALYDTFLELGLDAGILGLKWPNDVLANGKKLSGILLETTRTAGGLGVIIGIGVNIAEMPDSATLEAGAVSPTSLTELNIDTDAATFLAHLAPHMANWERRYLEQGFEPVRAAWLARAMGLGTRITARLPNKSHTGIFEDIDQNGALILATATGRLVLPAADVYF